MRTPEFLSAGAAVVLLLLLGWQALESPSRRLTATASREAQLAGDLEALYSSYGLPPKLPVHASREPLPVFFDGEQVGRATSYTWSPLLKQSIALASVRSEYATPGTDLQIEHTVEFERRKVAARVVKTPFFNPARKRRP